MIIYKITNNINNKIYIGKRIWNKEKFLKTNYFGSGKYIKNALNKYGYKNFKREILEECKTKKELSEREKFWIKFYNSKIPNGYNIGNGGEGNNGGQNKGKKWTKSHKNKIRQTLKNKFKNGKLIPYFKGKTLSEESILKIKEKRKQQIFSEESKIKRSNSLRNSWKNPNSGFNSMDEREKGKKTSIGLKKYYSKGNHPANYIEREIRECECGCGNIFKCKINSKRKYFTAWHRK